MRNIAASEYFPGRVLNESIAACTHEILVFLNSDGVMLASNVLEALLSPLEDSNVQATFGRQLPRPDAREWVAEEVKKSFPAEGPPPKWLPFALPLAAMRRSIWVKHPFYTLAWGSEDTEWGHWANRSGYEIRYVPQACIMHSHNYTLRQLYGRRFIEGEADAIIGQSSFSLLHALGRYGKQMIQGMSHLCLKGCFYEMWQLPIVRLVDNWAYYQGQRLGKKRKQRGDLDASRGQQEVLQRYD